MKKTLILDNLGRIQGRLEPRGGDVYVYDRNGVYQGKTSGGKTYNKNGIIIAIGEIPGILIKSKNKLPIQKGGPGSGRKKLTEKDKKLIALAKKVIKPGMDASDIVAALKQEGVSPTEFWKPKDYETWAERTGKKHKEANKNRSQEDIQKEEEKYKKQQENEDKTKRRYDIG